MPSPCKDIRFIAFISLILYGSLLSWQAKAVVSLQSDFSNLPTSAVLNNVEVSGNTLILKRDDSGNYYSEGYIDIPITPEITGYLVQIDATRVNLFKNGDFESDQTVYTYYPSGEEKCNYVAKSSGIWFSTFNDYNSSVKIWPSNLASITTNPDDAADHVGKLKRSKDLSQIVPIVPGEKYTLRFDADLTRVATDYTTSTGAVSDQGLVVNLEFQDLNYNNITFFKPDDDSTTTSQLLQVYYANDGEKNFRMKILAMDCDTRVKYTSGDGGYGSDVTFNQCQNSSGTALTASKDDGTVTAAYGENDIAYASIVFASNWFGSNGEPADDSPYYALIDDITLHRDNEIEAELLDASGTVLQSSTVEEGFYLESNANAATLRVYLRTSKDDETPVINSITMKDGWDVSVAVGAKSAEFPSERLGAMQIVGPKSDVWNENIAIRSLCTDPIAGDEIACFDFNTRYDMHSYRLGLTPSYMELVPNTDGTDYDFELTDDGEKYLARLVEYNGYGMEILAILQKDGAFKYNNPDDGLSSAKLTYVDDIPDPTGARDATAQAYYLMQKYASFWSGMLNGSTTYTYRHIKSGASVTLPKVTHWEIFNEDNIHSTKWLGLDSWGRLADATERAGVAKTMADLAENLAGIVKTAIPDAQISFTGMASNYGPVFNTEDAADYLNTLDPDLFNMTNFHPYSSDDRDEDREEVIEERWEAMKTTLSTYGFSDKDHYVTEYGDTHEIYDPGCTYNSSTSRWTTTSTPNTDWERGYGDNEHGKLFARQTLSLLALPFARVNPYGMHTYENESHGYTANTDGSGGYECWQSHSIYNFNIFKRIDGTGVLAGINEPSRYEALTGGKAYVTIANNLSISSPMDTAISSTDTLASNADYFHARMFETRAGEYVLALWWYQDYTYGSDVSWMSYIAGARDEGFTERRLLNVTLTGISGINSAELVPLDASAGSVLPLSADTAGVMIKNIPVGEMPVLVKLAYDTSLDDSDSDGDGMANIEDADDDNDGTGDSEDSDADSDADGVADTKDALPTNSSEYKDSDGDGTGDNADTDDDNDGIPDTEDVDEDEAPDSEEAGASTEAPDDETNPDASGSDDAVKNGGSCQLSGNEQGAGFIEWYLLLLSFLGFFFKKMIRRLFPTSAPTCLRYIARRGCVKIPP